MANGDLASLQKENTALMETRGTRQVPTHREADVMPGAP